MSDTGMEYRDGRMEEYITESGNRESKMEKDIKGGQMALNIGESGRMACYAHKRKEYCTETQMKKASSSAEVKYHEILQ
jgi:hypothetical protein